LIKWSERLRGNNAQEGKMIGMVRRRGKGGKGDSLERLDCLEGGANDKKVGMKEFFLCDGDRN